MSTTGLWRCISPLTIISPLTSLKILYNNFTVGVLCSPREQTQNKVNAQDMVSG